MGALDVSVPFVVTVAVTFCTAAAFLSVALRSASAMMTGVPATSATRFVTSTTGAALAPPAASAKTRTRSVAYASSGNASLVDGFAPRCAPLTVDGSAGSRSVHVPLLCA